VRTLFAANLKLAWRSMVTHKFRTILTVTGVVIGLTGVIAIVSMGEGMKAAVMSEFSGFGSNWLYIFPQSVQQGGQAWGHGRVKEFTSGDVEALKREAEHVDFVLPGSFYGALAQRGNKRYNVSIQGTVWEYFEGPGIEVERGRPFNEREQKGASRVAVIGATVRENLFEEFEDPLGQLITLGGENFTVVGVLKKKGQRFGGSEDTMVLVPLTTMQHRITGSDDISFIVAISLDLQSLDRAKDEVTQILRKRRRISDPTQEDFQVMSLQDTLEFANRFFNVLIIVFGFMSLFALIVSGINIMNIMLVTVTERSREVGLRMALGAQRRAVLLQFLIEAGLLTFVGGVIGVAAGWGLGALVGRILSSAMGVRWTAWVPLPYIIIALAVAVAIGIAFGLYPASRASRLDPVVAMRMD